MKSLFDITTELEGLKDTIFILGYSIESGTFNPDIIQNAINYSSKCIERIIDDIDEIEKGLHE